MRVNNKLPHKVKKFTFMVKNYDTGYIVTIKELERNVGINYESLKNKMSGATELKRGERVSVKRRFSGRRLYAM